MYLYEYEAREILASYDIPVEDACLASSPEEVRECLRKINPPYIIKAQVRRGGRGRLGGVKEVTGALEAFEEAADMIGKELGGFVVKKVLIAQKLEIKRELYLSFIIDKEARSYLLLASPFGGVEVEEIHKQRPQSLLKIAIDPIVGLRDYMVRRVIKHLGLSLEQGEVIRRLYRVFIDYGCELLEINPLAVTEEGVFAVDRRMIVDESFAGTSPLLAKYWNNYISELSKEERIGVEQRFSYVKLDGDIGVMGNGAGLTMATMDLIRHLGGKPGVFLDIGGGASAERVSMALSLMLRDKDVNAILVNILGGITRCDEVARGIVNALERYRGKEKKIVVRLSGLNEEEGRRILAGRGVKVFVDPLDAIKEVVGYGEAGK